MPYTIGDARSQVLDHLDDVSGARYARVSNVIDYTKIDRALRASLEQCLSDYTAGGGDRFDEDVDVTTDTTGSISLVEYDPIAVRGVQVIPDTTGALFPIEPGALPEAGLPDNQSRNLRIRLVRSFRIKDKPDTSDLLVGLSDGKALSWSAFDEWVCARAALKMGVKDNEMRESLLAIGEDLRASVMAQKRIPQNLEWPQQQVRLLFRQLAMGLRWGWTPRTRTLRTFFVGYFAGAM